MNEFLLPYMIIVFLIWSMGVVDVVRADTSETSLVYSRPDSEAASTESILASSTSLVQPLVPGAPSSTSSTSSPGDNTVAVCVTDNRNRNYTDIYTHDYGGIFITFALNVLFTFCIMLLFSFMRKGIGGYARLGVTIVRAGFPHFVSHVTQTAQNAANRITETGNKIRNSRIVSHNLSNPGDNSEPASLRGVSSMGRCDERAAVTSSSKKKHRSRIPDEFANLPESEETGVNLVNINIQSDSEYGAVSMGHCIRGERGIDVNRMDYGASDTVSAAEAVPTDVSIIINTPPSAGSGRTSNPHDKNHAQSQQYGSSPLISDQETELEQRRMKVADEDERSLFSWIKLTLTLNMCDFGHKVNSDAVQYLHFQRHVIGFMSLNTIFCILVLLPINIIGGVKYNNQEKYFGRLTLNNLEPDSNLLLVHSVHAFAMCVMMFIIMERFDRKYVRKEASKQTTVLVRNFPISRILQEPSVQGKPHLVINKLENYFIRVLKLLPANFQIYLVYDVGDLEKLVKQYNKFTECLEYVLRKNANKTAEVTAAGTSSSQSDDNTIELSSVATCSKNASSEKEFTNVINADITNDGEIDITEHSREKWHVTPTRTPKVLSPQLSVLGSSCTESNCTLPGEQTYVMAEGDLIVEDHAFRVNNVSTKRLKWHSEAQYINLEPITYIKKEKKANLEAVSNNINHRPSSITVATGMKLRRPDTDTDVTEFSATSPASSKSDYSRRGSLHRASLYIRDSVTLHQLNLKFNKCCGGFLCCFCNETRDAYEYYSYKRIMVLEKLVTRIRDRPFEKRTLPMFFLTLPSKPAADAICNYLPLDTNLVTQQWEVSAAPNVDDVIWENLSLSTFNKRLRWCIAQILFTILFLFISTPSIVIQRTEELNKYTSWRDHLERVPMVRLFIAPLIFVILAALLPFLIILISDIRGFSTKSKLNYYNYTRVYIFLFFMVLFLPSIGLTNLKGLIEEFIRDGVDQLHYSCIFHPENGAFFVNYVISASMIGLMAELLRIADMLFYLILLILMKSKAERKFVKKQSILQFPYGYCYAFQLLAACIVIVYSPICPIIAPFGLFYSLMRHYVDRYNLYFSFEPSKLNQSIHNSSSFILLFAGFLSLVILFIYSVLNTKSDNKLNNANTILLLLLIIVVLSYWLIKKFLHMVNSVSKGVIETSNLIRQASQDDVLGPAQPPSTVEDAMTTPASYDKRHPKNSSGAIAQSCVIPKFQSQNALEPMSAGDASNIGYDIHINVDEKRSKMVTDGVPQQNGRTDSIRTMYNENNNEIFENGDESLLTPAVSVKKGPPKSQKRSSAANVLEMKLQHIKDSDKYVPPVYHLINKTELRDKFDEGFKPKKKNWFSAGPDPPEMEVTRSNVKRELYSTKHRRSASDGVCLDKQKKNHHSGAGRGENRDSPHRGRHLAAAGTSIGNAPEHGATVQRHHNVAIKSNSSKAFEEDAATPNCSNYN